MKLRSTLLALCVACTTNSESAPAPRPMQKPTSGPVARKAAAPTTAPMQVAAVTLPQIATSAQIAGEAQEAPWSLTATDGSGLLVTRVEAKAVVQGPLAFTELHLYFENTENRIREGTFSITLPSGAAVSRFAMQNGEAWMEAEVVEKQLARRAYEDFLHRRQDPALLEKAAGNQFSARVFPIAAKAQKHLVISFSQELPGARYVLPLRGLPKVERVDVSLDATGPDGTRGMQTLSKRNWKPDADFVSSAATSAEALTAGTYVVAQISAFDQAQVARDAPAAMTLLVDTSASRALGFERYTRTIRDLVGTLAKSYGGAMPIEVLAFDQDTQSIYRGPASGFGDSQVAALIARGAAGASDLGQALATMRTPNARVVVVTDGVLTAGASGDALVTQTRRLATSKVERLDVVLAGGIRDEQLATSLVQAGLPRTGAVLDLDAGLADVAIGLGERVLTDVAVDVPGATWVYPRTIKSARPNQRTMIYARLAAPARSIEVSIAGKRRSVGLATGTPALIERAAATAQIAELEDRLGSAKPEQVKALRAEIAKRSVSARVISSQTSLLVLESEADYARYGIDRRSLGDILVVGANGLEQTRRAAQLAIAQPTTTTTDSTTKNMVKKPGPAKKRVVNAELADRDVDGDAFGGDADKADEDFKANDPEQEAPKEEMADARSDGAPEGTVSTSSSAPAMDTPTAPPPMRSVSRPRPASVTTPGNSRAQRETSGGVSGGVVGGEVGRANGGAALEQSRDRAEQWPPPGAPAPLKGKLAEIDRALKSRNVDGALAKARAWHHQDPGDVLALIGLGEALEAKRDLATASRIYGSIIDLFPGRADLRRFAGERLERIGAGSRTLAIDTYRRAVEERPDHLTGHRLLAYALLRDGKLAEAFTAILAGLDQKYPDGRYQGGDRVLKDDAGLIGAAYAAKFPGKRAEIAAQLQQHGTSLPTQASTRFIMYWETDANDVDFHIQDARGGHAFFSNKNLPSGGELYADITTGYGPECFAIEGTPKAGPYRLSINYYSQGPMGYGMGLLQIVKHDGKGTLTFQDRPYVIMADHAFVDLGTYQ
jgi:hypothetical protein